MSKDAKSGKAEPAQPTNGLLGKKLGMTQLFDEEGRLYPVTVVEAGPCRVTEVRTKERHGYEAVQVAWGDVPDRKLTKAELGHLKKGQAPASRHLREFKKQGDVQVGQVFTAELFRKGDWVDVEGISKGKGFQGVIKRHHYRGGPETHGHMFHRAPGSIGSSSFPSRVWKNKGLPGHMGHERVTVQRLRIVESRPDENLLFIRGAVPGPAGGLLVVRKSKKA
jgi:large subunit ribosomal protein L3